MSSGVSDNFVMAKGRRTHYLQAGEGPPLVLIHGAGPGASARTGWINTIPALARQFRVIAIDTLGFGLTDKPTDIMYTDQASVNHLADFLDALCLDKVSLCGNSRGAYIGVRYMLDNPHRVDRILMISSATIATAMGLVWRLDQLAGLKALEAYDGTPAAMRRFLELIINDHSRITDAMVADRVRNAALPGHDYVMKSQREYRNKLRDDPELQQLFDIRHRLPKIRKPMHVVWGAKDNFAPPSFADELRGVLPNVTFEIFEKSGHQSQSDEPERFNERALTFFSA